MPSFKTARIVGSGLIGTSIALRLRELDVSVDIFDSNQANLALARDLVSAKEVSDPDVTIIATPVNSILESLKSEFSRHTQSIFIEVSGIKSNLVQQVEKFSDLAYRFCAVHPMAGREVTGPQSARADLFESRAWIVSPTSKTSERPLQIAKELGEILGSTVYEISPDEHDSAIAAVSQLPQILSSLLGASLLDEKESSLDLAGQGLRDMTRLADSNGELWAFLLSGNAEQLIPRLKNFVTDIEKLSASLKNGDVEKIKEFITRGNKGKALIPGKHGAKKRDYTFLPIVISDKPGQLAAIFNECAEAKVNIEDLELEHSPGQETGLITLSLSATDAEKLKEHLQKRGWLAHEPRK